MMLVKLLVLLATIAGMANEEHVRVAKRGAMAIRVWRDMNPESGFDLSKASLRYAYLSGADLSEADPSYVDLSESDLTETNLSYADLGGANLGFAYLVGADLSESDLSKASLRYAYLSGADLSEADLSYADLSYSNLSDSKLQEVTLAGAAFHLTTLANLDLSAVSPHELQYVNHRGPSNLSTNTLVASRGMIPEKFLRGCGLSDWEVEQAKLYREGLKPNEIADIHQRVFDLRTEDAVRLHPVFLSHSHDDKSFVNKLHDGLQDAGVRCWLDEKQLVPGDDLHEAIDRGVTVFDKFVLVCSEASLAPDNSWVKREMLSALEKEEELTKRFGRPTRVIVPIRIDDYALEEWEGDGLMRRVVKSRHFGDFRNHQDDDAFKANLELLIKALRADAGGREPDPPSLFGMDGEA